MPRTSPRPGPRPAAAGALALLLAAAVAGCGSSADRPPTGGHPAGGGPAASARPAPSGPASDRIGALFVDGPDGARACTAGVVHSPGRNLLITAAHCAAPGGVPLDGLVFAPGYRDGLTPHGTWPVAGITVDPAWTDDQDEDRDVAFLTVGPLDGRQVEDAVGADALAAGLGPGLEVTVTGYPNADDAPITCRARAAAYGPAQQRFDCAGFTNGTSGSPWITGAGQVVGVIGGYQEGGDTADTSYSVLFDAHVTELYRRATAG
ncbi:MULTISPECIES: trypsin-like peptidase domain-containing protein [Kitasatospora]|uniref:Putative peptidase n=1 Tax=Kitasatospora setae (strain ATCC 33774 / DSM 43861 / JCM 3304 / KCC A-0304 / NBRC 14216 / KM-6054) TaxID=452652 RepID=E4NAU2_KITSK|nr:trypsin-like peptidase domain-containing protein [Kitasatospora setae]BAJ28323.1 putative peptidase [Kitasatospora setae KM-6054]